MKEKISMEIYFPGNGVIQLHRRSGLSKVMNRLNRYLEYLDKIFLISFGGADEYKLLKNNKIQIFDNKAGINKYIYFLIFPFIHRNAILSASFLECRQVSSGIIGLYLKLLYRKKVIVRCGYDWVEFADREGRTFEKILSRLISYPVYKFADGLYVTSERHYERILQIRKSRNNLVLVPNAVDINEFSPRENEDEGLIVSVGRLEKQKNFMNLIIALKNFPFKYQLLIFGQGKLKESLLKSAEENNVNLKLMGNVSSRELIKYLNKSMVFILPSNWEGNSNALIEAVSCGCAVIASDIEANREIIKDNQNGLLCSVTASGIRERLLQLFEQKDLRERIRTNARKSAEGRFNLENQTRNILNLYRKVLDRK